MKKQEAIFLLIMLLIPIRVFADSVNLIANCGNNKYKVGDTISCQLTGNTDVDIIGIEIPFTLGEGLAVNKFIPADEVYNYQSGSLKTHNIIQISTGKKLNGNFSIGTLELSVSSISSNSTNLSFRNGRYLSNPQTYDISPVSVTINLAYTTPQQTNPQSSDRNNNNNNNSNNTNNNVNNNNNNNNSNNNNNNNGTVPNTNNETNTVITDDSDEIVEGSTYLTDIEIEGYSLPFSREKIDYELTIGNEDSLLITPILEEETATYNILGNSNLINGSVIRIVVTSSSGDNLIYKINIKKQEKKSSPLIFIIIIAILVIINILRIVLNRINNQKK